MSSSAPNPMSADRTNKKFTQVRAGKKFEKKKDQHLKKLGVEQRKDESRKHSAKQKSLRVMQKQVNKAQLSARAEDLHTLPRLRVNKNYHTDPPKIVVVAGGKGSGKSTIITSLIRHYTRRKLEEIKGPITVKAGMARVTFVECPSDDMNALIDLSKVADIVLFAIDTSFGFQMETFEFLNLLQVQGFPRIMGVMTKLDTFKHVEKMKTARRSIKKRFRDEISDTAKLFYFSGLRDGFYTPRDTTNLARFLSTKKPKPLTWRSAHPYILADRIEDITHPSRIEESKTVKRNVVFYGWVRGTSFKTSGGNYVHIPGAGDFEIATITSINDPLPPNTKKTTKQNKEKQRGLYAPMTTLENVTFTQDAIYVEVDDDLMKEASKAQRKSRRVEVDKAAWNEEIEEQNELLKDLQSKKILLDQGLDSRDFSLLRNGVGVKLTDSEAEKIEKSTISKESDHMTDIDMSDVYENDPDVGTLHSNWKDNMLAKAKERFLEKSVTLHTLVYESEELLEDFEGLVGSSVNLKKFASQPSEEDGSEIDMLFSKLHRNNTNGVNRLKNTKSILLTSKEQIEVDALQHDWSNQDTVESIRNMFVTGDWSKRKKRESGEKDLNADSDSDSDADNMEDGSDAGDSDDDDKYHDDDEGVGKKYDGESDSDEDEELLKSMQLKDDEISVSGDEDSDMDEKDLEEQRKKKKAQFDDMYDQGGDEEEEAKEPEFKSVHEFIQYEKAQRENPQDKINRATFEELSPEMRERIEGLTPGTYVRMEIREIPHQFVELLNPLEPVIVGGIKPEEMQMGLVKMRIKRHRWFARTLKTKDPLVFSVGWRRFQSIPYYCTQDANGRLRYIKYTPDHMHCLAVVYAPFVPQNTGVVAIQNISGGQSQFRISATGYTLESDQKIEIVKKLKLLGYPKDIKKNTCIITQMFNSDLEVAKFQGAKLRSVSGIRGRVRKAISKDGAPGDFRATFEDRLLPSDIVFLRTWYPVKEIRFYNPVLNRYTKNWIRMRTVGELRHAKGLSVPQKDDSEYRAIKDRNTVGHEVSLAPKAKVALALPFEHQKKEELEITGVTTDLTNIVKNPNREKVKELLNALKSDEEKQRENLISRLEAIDADRRIKRRKQETKRELKRLKEVTKEERELRKRKRITEKERHIKSQLNRAKRARYSAD